MMRLFVQHADRTVALTDGDAMTDLVERYSNKSGNDLPASFHLCLDVDGHPHHRGLGRGTRHGDGIRLTRTDDLSLWCGGRRR
jgi:hypothetical protein